MKPDGSDPLVLQTPSGAPNCWTVSVSGAPPGRRIRVSPPEPEAPALDHDLRGAGQADYLDLHAALARVFGTRTPLGRRPPEPAAEAPLTPLLTAPVSPDILYGYGDPSVLRVEDGPERGWWLVVTSNDAPQAFPVLRSDDLAHWRPAGFVFPEGRTPAWTLAGENRADFWAPEMHRVGEEFWVCFAAREHDRSLAVGLARAASPAGPFTGDPAPLVRGGVIDPHIALGRDGAPWLLWKRDDNDLWPGLLGQRLHDQPELIARLFPAEEDRRTASLLVALWPWARTLEPMERFFLVQPLIEAVTSDFAGFRARLAALPGDDHRSIEEALRTRILAQRLAPDGRSLLGEPRVVLENDQPWEAHLIEGVWIAPYAGRWLLFYAGNDFSTPDYGIGVAVADDPFGPYRKAAEPFIRSTPAWSGPGHPSVAPGPDGRPRLFLHAFKPGEVGYKAFRALLCADFALEGDRVVLRAPSTAPFPGGGG